MQFPPAAPSEPDARTEAFRTANAIFSLISLIPMHVNGAYRAAPLPPGMTHLHKKK